MKPLVEAVQPTIEPGDALRHDDFMQISWDRGMLGAAGYPWPGLSS